jgi:transposase
LKNAAQISLPEIVSLEQARDVLTTLFSQLQQSLWRVAQLESQLFGSSSERRLGEQLSREQILMSLFPAPVDPAATQEVLLPADDKKSEPRPRRQPAAQVLETVTERIEPAEKVCAHCGKDKCEIGCEKSERFEYVPAKVIRHEILRPKLACPCGESGVSIASLPPSLVEQGMPGPGLLAHLLLSKYDDHLPLYRQQQQFARLGVTSTSRRCRSRGACPAHRWFTCSRTTSVLRAPLSSGRSARPCGNWPTRVG